MREDMVDLEEQDLNGSTHHINNDNDNDNNANNDNDDSHINYNHISSNIFK